MTLAELLDLIASALVLAGLGWGGVSLLRSKARVEEQKRKVLDITAKSEALPVAEREDWRAEQMAAAKIQPLQLLDLVTLRQDIELAVIAYLRPTLKVPFVLAVAGTVLGFVAAWVNATTG
jgi:hypothetical protein